MICKVWFLLDGARERDGICATATHQIQTETAGCSFGDFAKECAEFFAVR